MLKEIIPKDFLSSLNGAKDKILESNYIRILTHYDGDGTSAAIIITKMLERLNIPYHLSFIKDLSEDGFKKRIMEEPYNLTLIADAGSDQLKFLPDIDNIIVLDHHYYEPSESKAININVRDFGFDGTREACGATMAFLLALAVDESNSDLLKFMVAGAIADKQDIGGFRGLNLSITTQYGKSYNPSKKLNLTGNTLLDALTFSTDPFFYDLTGKTDNIREFLRKLELDPSRELVTLNEDECSKLGKALFARLILQGCEAEALKYLETEDFQFEDGFTGKALSKIIDGNAKIGANGIPVHYFLNENKLREQMMLNWKAFETKLIDYAYRSYKEISKENYIQYFYSPGSEMAGAISGILMLYIADQSKPIIGFNAGDSNTLISSRGTRNHVNRGLNLSIIMKEACKKVGGSGGGHDIAAGGVIPRGTEKQFIEIVDGMVAQQMNGKK
ncbi:MAG: DHHA1 domain-containing protein [Thermoplasmataceae archaeon]